MTDPCMNLDAKCRICGLPTYTNGQINWQFMNTADETLCSQHYNLSLRDRALFAKLDKAAKNLRTVTEAYNQLLKDIS